MMRIKAPTTNTVVPVKNRRMAIVRNRNGAACRPKQSPVKTATIGFRIDRGHLKSRTVWGPALQRTNSRPTTAEPRHGPRPGARPARRAACPSVHRRLVAARRAGGQAEHSRAPSGFPVSGPCETASQAGQCHRTVAGHGGPSTSKGSFRLSIRRGDSLAPGLHRLVCAGHQPNRSPQSGSGYSAEVPQPARTSADSGALLRTVTCGDGRSRTGCLLMACKRSGVRIPIAPLLSSRL